MYLTIGLSAFQIYSRCSGKHGNKYTRGDTNRVYTNRAATQQAALTKIHQLRESDDTQTALFWLQRKFNHGQTYSDVPQRKRFARNWERLRFDFDWAALISIFRATSHQIVCVSGGARGILMNSLSSLWFHIGLRALHLNRSLSPSPWTPERSAPHQRRSSKSPHVRGNNRIFHTIRGK